MNLGTAAGIKLGTAPTTRSIALASKSVFHGQSAAAYFGQGSAQRLVLELDGIIVERDPSVAYDIYIDLPKGASPDPKAASYVGSLDFYTPRLKGGASARYDITPLARRAGFGDRELAITFVPVDLAGPTQPGAAAPQRTGEVTIRSLAVRVVASQPQ